MTLGNIRMKNELKQGYNKQLNLKEGIYAGKCLVKSQDGIAKIPFLIPFLKSFPLKIRENNEMLKDKETPLAARFVLESGTQLKISPQDEFNKNDEVKMTGINKKIKKKMNKIIAHVLSNETLAPFNKEEVLKDTQEMINFLQSQTRLDSDLAAKAIQEFAKFNNLLYKNEIELKKEKKQIKRLGYFLKIMLYQYVLDPEVKIELNNPSDGEYQIDRPSLCELYTHIRAAESIFSNSFKNLKMWKRWINTRKYFLPLLWMPLAAC